MQRRLNGLLRRVSATPIGAKRWLGKGFWSIADQGLFAASNFILNIMLARWLMPADYGAFSVVYTLFLLFGTFHTAMLTEPMLVFGPGKHKQRFREYLSVLVSGHWRFAVLIGLIFGMLGFAFWLSGSLFAPLFFTLILAGPLILFQWLMRRACYVQLRPQLAAYAGLLYVVLMLGGVFGLVYADLLSAVSGLVVMAVASLGSGLWLVRRLGLSNFTRDTELASAALQDHWTYGRWALGTGLLGWIPGNIFMLFLPAWWGLDASGSYRAVLNLLLPMMNVTTALGTVLLPALVKRKDGASFGGLILRLSLLFTLAPLVYWLLLGYFSEPLILLLYGGQYSGYADILWLAALIPVIAALAAVSGAALRALELPNKVFIASAASTGVTVTIGLGLVFLYGVSGALLGWLVAYLVTASFMAALLWRNVRASGRSDERALEGGV